MRVLHVMEATIGGTRRHLVDAALGQREAGLDVHLAASAERAPAFRGDLERLARHGVGIHEVPMVRAIRPALDRRHYSELRALLRELRPDVVHTHCSKGGALGRLASLSTGIGARVHSPHTFAFLFHAMFGPAKRRVFRTIEGALGRRTDRMVAVSQSEGETIGAAGVVPRERIRVVANGIDPAPWIAARPLARREIGVPEGAPLAAVVGLLNAAKGQDLAIEALAEPGCERLHLLIAGEGEDAEALARLARERGVADRAHLLGWRDDVPALLATADFLLLPSRWEGMPYIVMEAMAVGLPVVATRVDGACELVLDGRTGRLVESECVEELATACADMAALAPEARSELGRRGRERVLAEFTAQRMVAGLIDVYREVA